MTEATINAGAETTPEQTQVETPQVDLNEVMEKLKRFETANQALKADNEKLVAAMKEHGSEMKAKKERERLALEEAGKYKELLEMTAKEKEEYEKSIAEFQTQRQQWEAQRRRFAVMSELQKPGAINTSVPPDDIIHFIDLSAVELDEAGKVIDWKTHHDNLLKNRDYLKPTAGNGKPVYGLDRPAAGTGATSEITRDADLLVKNMGITREQALRLADDKNFMERARKDYGFLKEPVDLSVYSPTQPR